MTLVEVSHNRAGWLDRPLLGGNRIYLSNASAGGPAGSFVYFEVRNLEDGALVSQLCVDAEADQEVFASRPHLNPDGSLLVAVHLQNDRMQLHRLDPEGDILQSWRWESEDYPELAACDLTCKLFPGLVGWLGDEVAVSWLYRQGRVYRTVGASGVPPRGGRRGVEAGLVVPEWALVFRKEAVFTATSTHVQARDQTGELLWQIPAMTFLGQSGDWVWLYDERARGELELERAESYLIYLQAEGLAQEDFPESEWSAGRPIHEPAWVLGLRLADGEELARIPVRGQLRSFASVDLDHWTLVESTREGEHRVTVQLADQAWQRCFPGAGGCDYLGHREGHTWWSDAKSWHCRDSQGKSVRSGFWPSGGGGRREGFEALGFGPRICDRGPLWSNAVLGPQQLVARHGAELLLI